MIINKLLHTAVFKKMRTRTHIYLLYILLVLAKVNAAINATAYATYTVKPIDKKASFIALNIKDI